jgi:hypothetical protein
MNFKVLNAIFITAGLFISNNVSANFLYSYTGSPLDISTPIGVFKSTDFVTASLYLDEQLEDGLNWQFIEGLPGFRLVITVAGITTDSAASPPEGYGNPTDLYVLASTLNGKITRWGVNMTYPSLNPNHNHLEFGLSNSTRVGQPGGAELLRIGNDQYFGSSNGETSDMWRLEEITHQANSPSSLAIFALGLMGLASRRFKKQ